MLGQRLLAEQWAVRGTTRFEEHLPLIEEAGIEAAIADPDRPSTLMELVGDITVVFWLMGSALAEPEVIAAIHGPRLESFLARLVDTPVRGFVYEGQGRVQSVHLDRGRALVETAASTWQIPIAVLDSDPSAVDAWTDAAFSASQSLVSGREAK